MNRQMRDVYSKHRHYDDVIRRPGQTRARIECLLKLHPSLAGFVVNSGRHDKSNESIT